MQHGVPHATTAMLIICFVTRLHPDNSGHCRLAVVLFGMCMSWYVCIGISPVCAMGIFDWGYELAIFVTCECYRQEHVLAVASLAKLCAALPWLVCVVVFSYIVSVVSFYVACYVWCFSEVPHILICDVCLWIIFEFIVSVLFGIVTICRSYRLQKVRMMTYIHWDNTAYQKIQIANIWSLQKIPLGKYTNANKYQPRNVSITTNTNPEKN